MNQLLRKLIFPSLFFFLFTPDLPSQIVVFQYRTIPQENVDEFIYRETNYWSMVAKKAIDEGKMSSWALWQKIGGWNLPERPNFLFVNVFENASDLDNLNEIWASTSELFPDMPMSSISTDHLGEVNHQMVLTGIAGTGEGPPNYVRFNYAKATDMTRYLELEQSTWAPFIEAQIESGKTTQKTWRLGQVVMPAGTDLPFNAVTVDGYDKMSEAMVPAITFPEDTEFPDLTELNEVHDKVYIQVYALVKSVN